MKTAVIITFGFILLLVLLPLLFCFGVLVGAWLLLRPIFFALASWFTKKQNNSPTYSLYSESDLKQIEKNRKWFNSLNK